MSRHKLVKEFIKDVYSKWSEVGTQVDAYEEVEKQYLEETGKRVFKNYNSFKNCKAKHFKKGQHMPA